MTTYFVSRHPGATAWAARQGFVIDQQLSHFDPATLQPGDVVIGTLPIHLIEGVCARQGRYLHLTLDVPETWRGRDLSVADMEACHARLEEYRASRVVPVSSSSADQPQLFIAIATGQAVSNLPPILEYARPGDAVLWVESPEARQGQSTAGANPVLEQFGLKILTPSLSVHDINDPVEIERAARGYALDPSAWRLVIVTNGGKKLSPIGLLNAWRTWRPMILYGDVPPARLRVFRAGLEQSPEDCPYQRHRLDLEEILRCSGHARFRPDLYPATRIWPGVVEPATTGYGVDAQYTQRIHQEHDQYARTNKTSSGWLSLNDMQQTNESPASALARAMKKWRSAALMFFRQVRNGSNAASSPEAFLDRRPEVLSDLYNAAANLSKAGARQEPGVPPPASDLGQLFEQAVADRLVAWLQRWPETPRVLQSVWSNVRICRVNAPDDQLAEWDLVLVLRNGSLCCIECKAFDANRKDLDARLLTLQKAGSNLADMAVCGPLYTRLADQPWFALMHDLRKRVETASRFAFLPLTLPDQPVAYRIAGDPGDQPCPSFETALEAWLRRYVP